MDSGFFAQCIGNKLTHSLFIKVINFLTMVLASFLASCSSDKTAPFPVLMSRTRLSRFSAAFFEMMEAKMMQENALSKVQV